MMRTILLVAAIILRTFSTGLAADAPDVKTPPSAATAAAGWPGSGLRLWHARVPVNLQQRAGGGLVVTATAYDAAGRVLGQVKLGQIY